MSHQDQDSVVIVFKRGRRGYVVHAVGSDDKFQCKTSEDIGEACLEILEDPTTPRAQFDSGSESRISKTEGRIAKRKQFEPEPEGEGGGRDVYIGGRRTTTNDIKDAFLGEMDLADQMAYHAGSAIWGGLQNISSWRSSSKKKKRKKKKKG